MTMKDYFFLSIGLQQSAISSRWGAVIASDCAMTSIPHAPEMSHKNIITIHFHIWTSYTPTIVISRACHGFSIKMYIVT